MAYADHEKFSSLAGLGSEERVAPTAILPKTLAAGSGTLARLTPVAYNTSTDKWVAWTNGGANGTGTISGFLNEEVTLDASDELIANVILTGKIHAADVALPSGESQGNLDTALKAASLREKGMIVQGLVNVQ